jgi:hypothetical protein
MTTDAKPGRTELAASNQRAKNTVMLGIPMSIASRRPRRSNVRPLPKTARMAALARTPTAARSIASQSGLENSSPRLAKM